MKTPAVPEVHVHIHMGDAMTPVAVPKKPQIPAAVIQQRLENLRKGREKKRFNSDVYPKPTAKDQAESNGLEPNGRKGYYH